MDQDIADKHRDIKTLKAENKDLDKRIESIHGIVTIKSFAIKDSPHHTQKTDESLT